MKAREREREKELARGLWEQRVSVGFPENGTSHSHSPFDADAKRNGISFLRFGILARVLYANTRG